MKSKHLLYYALLLSPSLFLLSIVVSTVLDLYETSRIVPETIYHDLKDAIPRRYPHSFDLPDTIFTQDKSRITVYAFGESSLVLSDGGVFPEYLENGHHELKIVNLGVNAVDSLSIRQRVQEALSVARPDIMILYYGHNDYNVAYHFYILPNYYEKFDTLLRLAYFFYDESKPLPLLVEGNYDVFSRLNRPKLFNFFEQMRLLKIDATAFADVNEVILANFIYNNEAILDMAASQKIPVVLITPVGNLHAEPYGDLDTTTAYYKKGLETKDYRRQVDYLMMARDAEILTYDLRAKSPLVDYIRNLKRPNVFVLDLEKKLIEIKFDFGNDDFLDYFHFNDRSHRILADVIYEFIRMNNLAGQKGLIR